MIGKSKQLLKLWHLSLCPFTVDKLKVGISCLQERVGSAKATVQQYFPSEFYFNKNNLKPIIITFLFLQCQELLPEILEWNLMAQVQHWLQRGLNLTQLESMEKSPFTSSSTENKEKSMSKQQIE